MSWVRVGGQEGVRACCKFNMRGEAGAINGLARCSRYYLGEGGGGGGALKRGVNTGALVI